MISPVSFGSTYKISVNDFSSKKATQGHEEVMEYCYENSIPVSTQEHFQKTGSKYSMPKYSLTTTVVTPDRKDREFEIFCANRGIQYTKHETTELMTSSAIEDRVESAPRGMKKAYVDAAKLYDLVERQDSNLEHCESDYNNYYKDRLDFMIKSGEQIPASTLYIMPYSGKEEMLEYIDNYGAENINTESLSIDFAQRTLEPDHGMFFAMINAGLTEIPVYVNDDSYEVGKALGVLE